LAKTFSVSLWLASLALTTQAVRAFSFDEILIGHQLVV
jgi:hypothetical protein